MPSNSKTVIANVCKSAIDRWHKRYQAANAEHAKQNGLFEHAKKLGDTTFIADAEGDFGEALDKAVMDSSEAHQNQMTQYLNSPALQSKFRQVIFDMLLAKGA